MKAKAFLLLFLSIFQSTLFYAQNTFSLNQGFIDGKNYLITIPYTETAGKIIIDVVINNKPRKFILDTGASAIISDKLYQELNPKVLKEIDVADASGTIESMKVVSLPSININKLVFKDTPAMVSKDSKIFLDCFGADGFIGSNMLRNSAVQFNHFTKTITITDDPKLLNLNKKNAAKMELTSTQSDPYIWIKLRNGKVVANEKILFDTGDDSFYVLSMSAYEQITKQLDLFKVIGQSTGSFSAGLHGIAPSTKNFLVNIPELEINDLEFRNVIAKTTYNNNSRFGSHILKYGKITLDYINRKFYMEPFSKNPEIITEENAWQIDPTMVKDKLVVGIIWDKALADKINVGDEIIKFDKLEYQNMNMCEIITKAHTVDKKNAIIQLKDVNTGKIKEVEIRKF